MAVLEARGNGAYYRTLDKKHRGAVAPGKTVTVSTSAKQAEKARFQMEGVPTYTRGKSRKDTTYVNGGEYCFTMPEENTQVSAVYKKVAVFGRADAGRERNSRWCRSGPETGNIRRKSHA